MGSRNGGEMRAAVYRSFGGPEVVRVEEMPKPVPKAREVLVRVHASTVSAGDYRMRTRDLPKGLGFFGPLTIGIFAPRKKILGMDFAGVVEAVGAEVMLGAGKNSRKSGKRVIPISFKPRPEDVAFEMQLGAAGAMRPVIDKTYELDQVAEAHRHVDTGRKRGSVVLRLAAG